MKKYLYLPSAMAVLAIIAGEAMGTSVVFPPVQVTSLAHSYSYRTTSGYGTNKDYFNILGGTGSAVTTPFVADLSTADTVISISLAAPAGKKFVFTVPSGATAVRLTAWIAWTSLGDAPVEWIWMPTLAFEGLSGTAPITQVDWGGYFGVDYVMADVYLSGIRQSFEFTALRIDFAVPAGGLSSWSKTYEVQNAACEAYASGPGLQDQIVLSIVDLPAPPDTTPPTIAINTPADGGAYLLGQSVLADWTATDSESGVASATGTVASGQPIDTSVVGTKSFTVTASDTAGNSAEVTATYHVYYGFGGLQRPYVVVQEFKIGGVIPLKWQYTDAAGSVVPSPDAAPRVWFTLVDTWTSQEEATPVADPGSSGCQYDSTTNTWQQNWLTTGLPQGTGYLWISCASGQRNGPYPVELRE